MSTAIRFILVNYILYSLIMTFAVVDYERMKRLQPPPRDIKFDLNTVSVIVIIIMAMYLYKRYVTVKQSRELYHV
jgi:hypothetical protein